MALTATPGSWADRRALAPSLPRSRPLLLAWQGCPPPPGSDGPDDQGPEALPEMLPGRGPQELPWEALQPGLQGGGTLSGRPPRQVQFLLPHTVIVDPPPHKEEKDFYRRLESLLGPDGHGGVGFGELFAAGGWEDLLEGNCLRKRLVQGGQGRSSRPRVGQEVTVKLLGVLEDLSLVERDPARTFVLGQGEAVQALDLGALSMQLGEVSLFLAAPACAYGHLGREPEIPREAALLYEVTLLQVRDPPDLGLLTAAERLSLGNQKRELGNFHFERKEYGWALRSYQRALQVLPLPGTGGLPPEEEEEAKELRVKCLNNSAAAQLKLQRPEEALASCDEVLRWDPDNVKALYRKGKLLSGQGEEGAAMAVLKRALQLEPATKAIHVELSKLARQQRGQPRCPGPAGTFQEGSAAQPVADGHQSSGSAPQPS
ncbi:hypothetical protein JRQ81_007025 [Phrynocephalus forsythii]|uniref:peptidylprolyl isomerase n=1 Tax=Phrynocephalus forsythii TaxID=171643 RepID=A0A9Q0XEJ7_9SAUR|nr:hypothetical protein JRQ81_007025 [Phrynocephalus forsythii]